VTINCAERGLLLLRVRDEIRITIAAYQTLYESSVAFGMRKALASEQGKSDLERKVRPELSMGRVDPWVELVGSTIHRVTVTSFFQKICQLVFGTIL